MKFIFHTFYIKILSFSIFYRGYVTPLPLKMDGNTVECCGIDQCGAIEQEKVYQDTANKCEWRNYSYRDCKKVMGSCDTTGCHTKTECTTKYSSEYCCQATIFKSNVILTSRDYNYVKSICPYDIQRQNDYCYIPNGTTGPDKKMCGYRYACVQSIPASGWRCSGGATGSNGGGGQHCTTYCGGTTGCHTDCH